MSKYKKSLFIFRRDLRLRDNTGLIEALKASSCVIPAFIFDPRQIENNPYRSDNALRFMIESLRDLYRAVKGKGGKLCIFHGKPDSVVGRLIKKEGIEAVFFNRDYTPFSRQRDHAIEYVCEQNGAACRSFDDCLIHAPGTVRKSDGDSYTVYTPYMKKALSEGVPKPQPNRRSNYYTGSIRDRGIRYLKRIAPEKNERIKVNGGRSQALKILNNIQKFRNYDKERDIPHLDATTKLSAHLKFGTVSPREVYQRVSKTLGRGHTLIRELLWRDFFIQVGYFYPSVLGSSFHEKYDGISWDNDKKFFRCWCEGRTGFPIVDAGMRELNETGYMHNRVRMITASFLTKDLHIDWRWGEKYFAQRLVDYDPLVNNGNWQWAASTGCDAQPYFRIFNPWRQQQRFDPDCLYIKRWVPELQNIRPEVIHGIESSPLGLSNYPDPIVDHRAQARKAKETYKRCV